MGLGDVNNKGENEIGFLSVEEIKEKVKIMQEDAKAAMLLADIALINGYILRCLSEDLKLVFERYKQQID